MSSDGSSSGGGSGGGGGGGKANNPFKKDKMPMPHLPPEKITLAPKNQFCRIYTGTYKTTCASKFGDRGPYFGYIGDIPLRCSHFNAHISHLTSGCRHVVCCPYHYYIPHRNCGGCGECGTCIRNLPYRYAQCPCGVTVTTQDDHTTCACCRPHQLAAAYNCPPAAACNVGRGCYGCQCGYGFGGGCCTGICSGCC